MKSFFILSFFVATALFAAPQTVRWTGKEDSNAEINHLLDVVKAKTGIELSSNDFMMVEDRSMATSHFTMLMQLAGRTPIMGQSLRIWTNLDTGNAIQVEAMVDERPSKAATVSLTNLELNSQATMEKVRAAVQQNPDDKVVKDAKWTDFLSNGAMVRVVKAKGRRGTHKIQISLTTGDVVDYSYEEFPKADSEFSIPVQIYPIYEEIPNSNGKLMPRQPSELRYLNKMIPQHQTDPYAALRTQKYIDDKFDPIQGLTVEGRKDGFWAMSFIKAEAAQILSQVPLTANDFSNGGVFLEGRYATVNLYPDVPQHFKDFGFTPQLSPVFMPDYVNIPDRPDHQEMVPQSALLGRPVTSLDDAWSRVARRDPNNNPSVYIADGFDELQVYWTVTQLFDSLHSMGWTDPELSTRRFNAFLYNADISMRDNAFYTDDTINFNTYSPSQPNDARDNTTIWHELGHGVMDRLMGDFIQLADTGGLSEGMADFVAQLVINDVTSGQTFEGKETLRIFNHTGFNLTNEVHDDGEAYGGTMNDILIASMRHFGRPGLAKMTDLTLETMRLTRDNPALTANGWFDHMLFADEMGHDGVRAPGELRGFILAALSSRNFNLDGSPVASMSLKNGDKEIVAGAEGSRVKPIVVKLKPTETAAYHMKVSLKNSATYQFKFPVTIKVEFNKGPLQGAVHWLQKQQGTLIATLKNEADVAQFDLSTIGKCDEINREDNSCVDYAYVQIWNQGEQIKPQAKKRFYLRVYPQN